MLNVEAHRFKPKETQNEPVLQNYTLIFYLYCWTNYTR